MQKLTSAQVEIVRVGALRADALDALSIRRQQLDA